MNVTTPPKPTRTPSLDDLPSDTDRPNRGRRMTWAEFYRLRPDRRPANDNQRAARAA